MRYFNTAGPCNPQDHYMLSPVERLPGLRRLIDQKAYFVVHAPRQVGKTTLMLTLAQQLTAEGRYTAVLLSLEAGAPFHHDPHLAQQEIIRSWRIGLAAQLPSERHPAWAETMEIPTLSISEALAQWAQTAPTPVVVFLDEIDALEDTTLISVLRQLRAGYPSRPQAFPWSLALIGMRDVRDYKVAAGGSDRLRTASPFNIKMDALTLGNFTADEVAQLYRQHTTETGQVFTDEAVAYAYDLTYGQPWLVNALARQATEFIQPDLTQPITRDHIEAAKWRLIERQDTHLDSLAERLQEPRVRNLIAPMLAGDLPGDLPDDDRRYVLDLGLVRRNPDTGVLEVANPVYREVLPRVLSGGVQDALPRLEPVWLDGEGRLVPEKLLEAFLGFWRQHGEPLLRGVAYHEIAPHIVLMAYLQRVENGGGRVTREYAIGSGRMDVCLRYGGVTVGIELKVWREGAGDPEAEGLEQLERYLAGLAAGAVGWLVIFDRRAGQPPVAERTRAYRAVTPGGRTVTVVRA
ncbi:AAA-like domain-containing protein [Chloracidobacterium validum]|uniref:AAA-like domain-containing protein n=1 Tax=Chloracidobacterium validum TaxID=2821543 RepID=A0ABX8BCR5_9BACT|nr:ATP-binding protein [Chloracidobacterium validum]QUW04707.1 AAA-like domain-containing protein [Chloracidobacterium validum]